MHFLAESLKKPEWVAAIALLIQAVILGLQWRILRRHAETMEQHKDIAATQAETAKLIGQAFQQQGKVLEEQTKIMGEQLKLQKTIESQAERAKLFDLLVELQARIVDASTAISTTLSPGTTLSPDTREKLDRAWAKVESAILPCQKALITAVHLAQDDQNYFIQYCQAVDAVARTRTHDPQQLKALENQYKDFSKRLMGVARTPV